MHRQYKKRRMTDSKKKEPLRRQKEVSAEINSMGKGKTTKEVNFGRKNDQKRMFRIVKALSVENGFKSRN